MAPKVKSQFSSPVTAEEKKSPLGNLILGIIKLAQPGRCCGTEKQEEQMQPAFAPGWQEPCPGWRSLLVWASCLPSAAAASDCCSSSLNYRRKRYDLLKPQDPLGSGFLGDYHIP